MRMHFSGILDICLLLTYGSDIGLIIAPGQAFVIAKFHCSLNNAVGVGMGVVIGIGIGADSSHDYIFICQTLAAAPAGTHHFA